MEEYIFKEDNSKVIKGLKVEIKYKNDVVELISKNGSYHYELKEELEGLQQIRLYPSLNLESVISSDENEVNEYLVYFDCSINKNSLITVTVDDVKEEDRKFIIDVMNIFPQYNTGVDIGHLVIHYIYIHIIPKELKSRKVKENKSDWIIEKGILKLSVLI